MADRKIYCVVCKGYCGTIRDASLKKGLVYTCEECHKPKKDNEFMDYFTDILSGKKK